MTTSSHVPVLLHESVHGLAVKPGGVYLDATVGAGGHAAEVAKRLNTGRLIGLDRDPETLRSAQQALAQFQDRIGLYQSNFIHLKRVLENQGIHFLDGALFDLGVSSMQIDQPDRGFSFMRDGPLDMRMGPDAPASAADVVNEYSQADLSAVLRRYGEERLADRIASAIVARRQKTPFARTRELAEVIENAYPAPARRKAHIHPATRTFQALRIVVNDELSSIEPALAAAFELLRAGGRLAVISFHSLEDRIVKQFFKQLAQGCTCPPGLPACVCGRTPRAKLMKRIRPSQAEIESNPRARSARLRVLEKLLGASVSA